MKFIRTSAVVRKLMWHLGRKMYTYARGGGQNACLRDVFGLIADETYRLGKLSCKTIWFYDQWHFELDRFFENNYVLVRNDSNLRLRGSTVWFDESNVGVSA